MASRQKKNLFFFTVYLYFRVEMKIITDKHLEMMWVPNNIKKYLYDYSHSKFIECNSSMAKMNLDNYPNKSYQNIELNNKIRPGLMEIKNILETTYKKYWIASGSLLGKTLTELQICEIP